MGTRRASIKETGEELSQEEWARFDAAVATEKARQSAARPFERDVMVRDPAESSQKQRRHGGARDSHS